MTWEIGKYCERNDYEKNQYLPDAAKTERKSHRFKSL